MIVGKVEIYKTRAKTLYIMDLPEGMKGARIKLDFKDPVWDGLIKMYTFENHDDLRNRVLPVDGVEIPSKVLVANTHLRFGVYGVDSKGQLAIPTIWADLGHTYPSANALSDPDLDPDLPVWAQILNRIGNLEQLKTLCKTDLVCAINEIYDIAQSVREDADAGEFSGATFTPILERVTDGVELSWVNDKGKPNPEPIILREKNEVSVQKKTDPVPEEAEFIIYEDEETVIPWIEADLTCASAPEASVKIVTNSDGSPAEIEDHQVRLIRFADGSTADKVTLQVGDQSFTMARNPWRYSDLAASCPVGEIPVGHTCLVHFDGMYAFWQDCGFRPLVSLAEEQFGWDMMKLVQGERQETVLSEAQVALADEIENKISQAGGVYLYFSTYDTTVKLSDFASGSNYFRFNAVDQGREFVFDYDKTTRTVAAYMIGYAKQDDLHQPCFATCTAEAAPSTTAPVTWYVPKTMPRPSGNPGMLIDVFWKNGRVDGLGYDISLVWGSEGGSDNEVIVPKISVNDSLTGEHGIPAEGTIRYQLEEIDGRRHWRYVSGDLIYKSFSSDTAADVADKVVPGMSIAYLPTMEIYVQLDKGNTADLMSLVPDEGKTLPVYGNGTGAKTGKITPGTILHLKNAGDHWQILNSGGGAIDDEKTSKDTTWSSDNIVETLCPPFSASGPVVICNPVKGYPLHVVSQIIPTQEGSGDPSPTNVRPIVATDKVALTQEAGGKTKTFTAQLPPDTYGGEVDWEKKELTHIYKKLSLAGKKWTAQSNPDGTKRWSLSSNQTPGIMDQVPNDALSFVYCNVLPRKTANEMYKSVQGIGTLKGGNIVLYVEDVKTESELEQFIVANQMYIVYQANNMGGLEVTTSDTPTALPGVNTIYSDTGDTTVSGRTELKAVSYKPQELTPEQQIQVQKNIGIGGNWELIEKITTNVDAAFERTSEPDGTPYNFHSIMIRLRLPNGGPNNKTVNFDVYADKDWCGTLRFPFTKENYVSWGSVERERGFYISHGVKPNPRYETNDCWISSAYMNGLPATKNVSKIASNTVIPSGTEIRIMAVRV